jgi:hypothetical protein
VPEFEAFRDDGNQALVVGGATGTRAANASLVQDAGAEIVVMDCTDVTLQSATPPAQFLMGRVG